MAFTIEQIEEGLKIPRPEWGIHYSTAKLEESPNYPVITQYLTGQLSSLPALPFDGKGVYWALLLNLVKRVNPPSANDYLVLNVIRHPDFSPYLNRYLLDWLITYIIGHPDEQSLQAVVSQWRQQGWSDEDVYSYFIHRFFCLDKTDLNIEGTALKRFIVDFIKKAKKLNFHLHGFRQTHSVWSPGYFVFIEEYRPDFISDYISHGLGCSTSPVVFFAGYRNGKYLPSILDALERSDTRNIDVIRQKLSHAICLYEADNAQFGDLAAKLAGEYIDHLPLHPRRYEAGVHLQEFKDTDLRYLGFTPCAFHLLFKADKKKAVEKLESRLDQKGLVFADTLKIVQYHLGKDAYLYIGKVLQSDKLDGIDEFRTIVSLLVSKSEPAQYLSLIWSFAGNKSKTIRDLVASTIAEKDTDAVSKATALLQHKAADTRQTAALVLSRFSTPAALDAIKKALDKETNDNSRDILLQTAAASFPKEPDDQFIEAMIESARDRGKLRKPVEEWLDEDTLPPLYDKEGKHISNDRIRFLLYSMSRVKAMRSDIEAKYIIQLLDKDKAAPFAMELIKLYTDKGAKPEHKYLLAIAALLGNDDIVDKIRINTNKWIDEARYKMAEYGVGALALQGSDKALRWVEWYSRKYRSKKANVGAAATAALETAAEELGITTHELGDKIVPDFGFDGLFRRFTIGNEQYRAFIDSSFKIAFFNEDDKKLKSLPASADAELKEEFKAIAKEVRDITRSQSSRLEYYLIIQRRWTYEQWKQFFLQNPVMFIYATKLLWGVYNEKAELGQTFLCNEDTSLANEEGEESEINTSLHIGIVHPTQLSPELLQKWKRQFFDLSIDQIFPQLERKIPDLSEFDMEKAIITKFEGKQMAQGSIRSTLERFGWRGQVADAGMIDNFYLVYPEKQMTAMLEVDGVCVVYGLNTEEKLKRLFIIDQTKIKQRWLSYPLSDDSDQLVKLKNVPRIFLSEMLSAVESIRPFAKPEDAGDQ